MKLLNFLSFTKSPKKYIKKSIDVKTEINIKSMIDSEFLIPINETSDKDIFIAGYPRSGNTLMQTIISSILYGIDTNYLTDRLAQDITPDLHARRYYKRFGPITFFKTHFFPKAEYKKVIHLVRDGREATVSYYHFLKNTNEETSYQEIIYNGKNLFPSKWYEHTKKWIENPYNAEILNIKYEELVTNPINEMQRICQFAKLERDIELLEKIAKGIEFSKMKKRVISSGGIAHKKWIGNKSKAFFRSGKIETYKNELSSELINYFENEAYAELKHFKYI